MRRFNSALVVIGDKLGLDRALAGTDGLSPAELAERTGTAEWYVREWLNAQAAGGFVSDGPDSGRYALAPERAVALTDPTCPVYLPGFFQTALGSVIDSPKIMEAARSGDGFGWHEHVHAVHEGCERFFRPFYNAHLLAEWLPIAQLAPVQLTLGVGIGGENRHEIEVCGGDPKTRGRRIDECLQILRGLADGTAVTFDGDFFSLKDALIVPASSPSVQLIVGGGSAAAMRRTALVSFPPGPGPSRVRLGSLSHFLGLALSSGCANRAGSSALQSIN
ncbi:MAG: LLM class flavin-dependent oxidoreductase [Solirubrobacteraceae bacterium]